MTPAELLTELERLDIKLTLAGDKLHVDAPAGVLTDDLKKALRQHKPGLVALLREQAELDSQAKEIARIFHERGWVAFEGRLLNGEVVVFVQDEKIAIPAKWQDAVRYTLAELEALVKPPKPGPEELRAMHEAKKVFEGRIEGVPAERG